jgi:hypothetical protein
MLDRSKAMLFKTESVKRGRNESNMDDKEEEEQEFDDSGVELKKVGIELTERMEEVSGLLNTSSEDK